MNGEMVSSRRGGLDYSKSLLLPLLPGGWEGGTEEEEESDHTSPPAMKRKVRLYSQINIGDVLTPGPVTVAKEDAGVTHKSLTRGMK